uniref:F-box/WD repeat-containing protein 7 n=1 Tax=Ornithorhynchus anatinus TaxID=9258 RepID=A0A6I8NZ51_ORNAN
MRDREQGEEKRVRRRTWVFDVLGGALAEVPGEGMRLRGDGPETGGGKKGGSAQAHMGLCRFGRCPGGSAGEAARLRGDGPGPGGAAAFPGAGRARAGAAASPRVGAGAWRKRPGGAGRELRLRGAAPGPGGAAAAAAAAGAAMAEPGGGKVDVNRAGVPELEAALRGVGRRRARAIVRKREELRGFGSLDDLLRVKGVTARILDLNRPRLLCGDPAPRPPPQVLSHQVRAEDRSGDGAEEPGAGAEGLGFGGLRRQRRQEERRQEEEEEEEEGAAGRAGPRGRGGRETEEEEEEEEEGEGGLPRRRGARGVGGRRGRPGRCLSLLLGGRGLDGLPGRLRHRRPGAAQDETEAGVGAGRAGAVAGEEAVQGPRLPQVPGPPDVRRAARRPARPGPPAPPAPGSSAPAAGVAAHLPGEGGGPGGGRRIWAGGVGGDTPGTGGGGGTGPRERRGSRPRPPCQAWSGPQQLVALDELLDRCEPAQVRHVMQLIQPQFQRDFISLLPKELALHVLSFLEPRDLLRAAQTCRCWRVLAEDNLLWREKCRDEGIEEPRSVRRGRLLSPGFMYSPWKLAFRRQHQIDSNWRSGDIPPPKVLKGHDDHVITCLQFCGNRIVSGSDDNTLKVWSAVTGECVQTLVGHTGGVWSSQMREKLVISGSTDRTLRVWDADSGACVHTLHGHTSTVRCLHLHGDRVVSGSRDATLRLWDVRTGRCLHVLSGHVAAVRCVQYDGRKVVSGAYDYTVRVWDPESESCLHTLQGHTNRVYSLQFDGVHIVSGSLDTSIRVWDVESGSCLHTLTGHQSLTSGMELREATLVSGNADSTVKIWDIRTGQCLQTLQGPHKHQSAVTCLQFSAKLVVTSSDDGTVKLWDLRTGDFVRDLVALESGGSGGVVWRIRASNTKLVCAVGSRNGTEETKLLVLDFDADVAK